MALYPGALPAAGTAVSTDTLAAAGHTALHNTVDDEARALGTKMGTGASTPTANTVLRGTGAGTSAWGQVDLSADVTEVLPVQNGGTNGATAAEARTSLGVNTALETLALAYPIGSIYINASDSTNPATLLGFGTWTAFGAGKVMVGLDSSDTDFDTSEETGGAKTHTHSLSDSAQGQVFTGATGIYARMVAASSWTSTHLDGTGTAGDTTARTSGIGLQGDTDADSSVQPYIVCYFWKRTA